MKIIIDGVMQDAPQDVIDQLEIDKARVHEHDAATVRNVVSRACQLRITAALRGKEMSMQRQETDLLRAVAGGRALTKDEAAQAKMFSAVNQWETAMVEAREQMIDVGDVAAPLLDASWPPPPSGLAEFLKDF